MQELLKLHAITKKFGDLTANDAVDFAINSGEIHALLGENGAGKSTLVKIIYGITKKNSGQILWQGRDVNFDNPKKARQAGICMVFQHFSLIPALTIYENIILSFDKTPDNFRELIMEKCREYQFNFDLDQIVAQLSVGECQRVEILRCLMQNPKLLIMDEPTSVLTPQEADVLFDILRDLAKKNMAILYISHRLEEIRALCDKATILRNGKIIQEINPKNTSLNEIASLMMGEEFTSHERASYLKSDSEIILQCQNLDIQAKSAGEIALKNINFTCKKGEILGIAGLAGNGQNEFFAALSGEQPTQENAVLLAGKPIGKKSVIERRKLGMGFAPEERNGHAAVPQLSLWENAIISLKANPNCTKFGFIAENFVVNYAKNIIKQFKVKTQSHWQFASALSGGNLQKFIMGREILTNPEVLIINQPTWGVDAGAAKIIHQAIVELAKNGSAIVVISQDLDELMILSDEISVLCEGELSRQLPINACNKQQIGLLMTKVAA